MPKQKAKFNNRKVPPPPPLNTSSTPSLNIACFSKLNVVISPEQHFRGTTLTPLMKGSNIRTALREVKRVLRRQELRIQGHPPLSQPLHPLSLRFLNLLGMTSSTCSGKFKPFYGGINVPQMATLFENCLYSGPKTRVGDEAWGPLAKATPQDYVDLLSRVWWYSHYGHGDEDV